MLPKWHPAFSILGNIGIHKNKISALKVGGLRLGEPHFCQCCLNGTQLFSCEATLAFTKIKISA